MGENFSASAYLLGHSRLEIFPATPRSDSRLTSDLLIGTKVAVTCPPDRELKNGNIRKGLDGTIRLTQNLARMGFEVVPHIAARSVRDEQHLEDILSLLVNLSVREIFVPGGDNKKPEGKFSSSLELLTKASALGYLKHFENIGIATYPEGHAIEQVNNCLLETLYKKQLFATYMVTQLSFKPKRIVGWLSDMRQEGIVLPAYIGIPGLVNKWALLRISRKIGVGGSRNFLRKNPAFLGELFLKFGSHYKPNKILTGIAPHLKDPNLNICGFHIYTFNQITNANSWLSTLLSS